MTSYVYRSTDVQIAVCIKHTKRTGHCNTHMWSANHSDTWRPAKKFWGIKMCMELFKTWVIIYRNCRVSVCLSVLWRDVSGCAEGQTEIVWNIKYVPTHKIQSHTHVVEVWLHPFLTSTLKWGALLHSHPGGFLLRKIKLIRYRKRR